MISEPEMTGGSQTEPARIPAPRTGPGRRLRGRPGAGAAPEDQDGRDPGAEDPDAQHPDGEVIATGGPAPRRLPRHWSWALTATATTCALGIAAVAVWDPTHRATPDLHGYTLAYSPCGRGALAALIGAPSPHTYSNPATFVHGPALDRAECTAGTLDSADSQGVSATSLVTIVVELHKKTDPRPEFEDQRAYGLETQLAADKVTHVPALGDDAYLLLLEPARVQLKVVRGGAVVEIGLVLEGAAPSARGMGTADASRVTAGAPSDLEQYGPRLIATARAVMADLSSG